jgi:hypothetical protein
MRRDSISGYVLYAEVECAQGLRRAPAQRSDEGAVVLVGDLPSAVIEFELLERGECTIAVLGQGKSAPLELVRPGEAVVAGLGLSQEGQPDQEHAQNGERGAGDELAGHSGATALA